MEVEEYRRSPFPQVGGDNFQSTEKRRIVIELAF